MAQNYKGPLDYIDVATRIAEFREKYPTGSLQQISYEFVQVANKDWIIYTAAAYRTPDDVRPGMGTAWEPIPGPTNFTRDSEVQNAETAAWGRAIVAVLAADTRKGIASSEEVRNRQAAEANKPAKEVKPAPVKELSDDDKKRIRQLIVEIQATESIDELRKIYTAQKEIRDIVVDGTSLIEQINKKVSALTPKEDANVEKGK